MADVIAELYMNIAEYYCVFAQNNKQGMKIIAKYVVFFQKRNPQRFRIFEAIHMAAPMDGHETEESDPESHGCHLPFAINYVIQYIFSRFDNFNVIRKSLPELRRN